MIDPEALAAWRDEFLRESGIDPEALADGSHFDPEADRARRVRAGELIPARYADALATDPAVRAWLATLIRQAIRDRRAVVSITRGPSLLLLGPTGTGKSHQAYGMLRGVGALGLRGKQRVITAADFYARLRPRHGIDSEAEFAEFAGASLLVIDDLGAMKNSEWIEEVNYRLVNYRYEGVMPTLFTSNLLPGDLANVLGERVSSRLTEMAERVTLKGEDRRYGSAA